MLLTIFEKILHSLSLTGKILERLRVLLSLAQNKSHQNANVTEAEIDKPKQQQENRTRPQSSNENATKSIRSVCKKPQVSTLKSLTHVRVRAQSKKIPITSQPELAATHGNITLVVISPDT